jgi:hypothetical protein
MVQSSLYDGSPGVGEYGAVSRQACPVGCYNPRQN